MFVVCNPFFTMKRIIAFIIFTFAFICISCDDEPLDRDLLNNPSACETSTSALEVATLNFVSATDANYSELCESYRQALQNQINFCGDNDSSLQLIIDSLGDCTLDNQDACSTSNVAVAQALTNLNNATSENYNELCNIYKTALEINIQLCGDLDGETQAIIDSLGDCN